MFAEFKIVRDAWNRSREQSWLEKAKGEEPISWGRRISSRRRRGGARSAYRVDFENEQLRRNIASTRIMRGIIRDYIVRSSRGKHSKQYRGTDLIVGVTWLRKRTASGVAPSIMYATEFKSCRQITSAVNN